MTLVPMSLAERIRKISDLGLMADASKRLGDQAISYDVSSLHRRAQRDATAQLLALIATPDGQEALKRVQDYLGVIDATLVAAAVDGLALPTSPSMACRCQIAIAREG